jgi:putative ABC transport system substrate-binding protein
MPKTKSLCLFLAMAFLLPACGQEEGLETTTSRIDALIIRSKDFALYDKAIDGFKDVFQGTEKIITMEAPLPEKAFLAEIRESNPQLILAVGLRAAKWIKAYAGDVPAVFCMAMHPVQNRLKTESMTGVHLEPSPEDQLRAFAGILPEDAKIGLLYDPKRIGRQVETIKETAGGLGVKILTRPVGSREEVPAALEEVVAEAQALWLLRDATVLTREFFNHTLVLQLSKRIPVIAYSEQFVRKGAYASYSASYKMQGEKAAGLANQILSGTSPNDIPLVHPDGMLTVNMRTGQMIGGILPSVRTYLPPGEVYQTK